MILEYVLYNAIVMLKEDTKLSHEELLDGLGITEEEYKELMK